MRAQPLGLRSGDRELLESWTRSTSIRAGLAQRARIVLLAADGVSNTEIAERVGVARQTVISWRERYAHLRGRRVWPMSSGRVGRGRWTGPRSWPRRLTPPPAKLGITHWSSRLLAEHLKVDASTVLRTWRHHRVQPWRAETFKFSTDPELVAKVTDVVGLYLHPPENAIVLSVDEKSQIQALDRTQKTLPMQPGKAGAAHPRLRPARHHDLVRRLGDRHRRGHRDLQTTAPPPGVPGVPPPRRPRLSRPAAAPDHGQLRHPQASEGEGLAGGEPAHPRPLHPDLRIVAEPGRGLVRHHRTPSHPPRHLPLGPRPDDQDPRPSSTAGTTAANPSSGPRPPTRS